MGHISIPLSVLLVLFATLLALPVRAENILLTSQKVSVQGDNLRVEIRFEQPMNYISHFPERRGRQLDIKLRPILSAQSGPIMANIEDSLSVGNRAENPLRDIQYEQDEHGNGNLTIQFSREVEFNVQSGKDRRDVIINLLHVAQAPANQQQKAALPAMNIDSGLPIYVLNLESESKPIDATKQPILKNFRGKYDIYTIETQQGRQSFYQLRLGYFHSLKLAKANLSRLKPFYPQAWIDKIKTERRQIAENWFVGQNVDRLSSTTAFAVPQTKTTTPAIPPSAIAETPSLTSPTHAITQKPPETPAVQTVETSNTAETVTPVTKMDKLSEQMETAKQAMISQKYRTAISYFTHILQNPDPTYHQEAQELLGLAWERLNLPAQAVAEYRKYLKQYPTGPDAERVRQRLTGLLTAKSKPVAKLAAAPTPAKPLGPKPTWDFFGSFSQFYRNQQFATDATSATTVVNSLDSDLIMSGRRRGQEWNQRLDFAATHRYDFMNKVNASDATIYSLFYDLADKHDDISMRIGRQTHDSDGVFGRFDGVIVNKRIGHNKKVSFLAGFPVYNITLNDSIDTTRKFYAASVKFESLIKNLDTKFYYINQTNDGMIDRVAIGNRTQYVDNFKSMFFIADYDVHYKQLNIATFIGNWRGKDNTNYNITADYRNSPILTTNNALIGQTTVTTLEQLRQIFTLDEVEQLAKDRTGEMKSLTVSVAKPLSARYQVNGDATVSSLSGTPASGGVGATDSTGNQYYYNVNLVANNFLSSNDITIMGFRYYTDITSRTTSVNFSSRFNVSKDWRLNPRMTIQLRKNGDGLKRTTYLPRIVIQARTARTWRFEMEFGYEYAKTETSIATTTEKDYYGYLGYTHDF